MADFCFDPLLDAWVADLLLEKNTGSKNPQ